MDACYCKPSLLLKAVDGIDPTGESTTTTFLTSRIYSFILFIYHYTHRSVWFLSLIKDTCFCIRQQYRKLLKIQKTTDLVVFLLNGYSITQIPYLTLRQHYKESVERFLESEDQDISCKVIYSGNDR